MVGLFRSQSDRQHRFCASNLSAYVDDALSGRDKQRVERHLAECVLCQHDLATLRQTRALLRRMPMRPVPRSFTLSATVQPEQARYRRWSTTQSFLRVATVAVTVMLVLLVSGDVLLSMGVLPIPDRPRPAREVASAPADTASGAAATVAPTRAVGQEETLSQQNLAPTVGAGEASMAVEQAPATEAPLVNKDLARVDEQSTQPELAVQGEASVQADAFAHGMLAPQATEGESFGAPQDSAALERESMTTSSPPPVLMAPKSAAARAGVKATPAEPELAQGVPGAVAGVGAGPTAAQSSPAPTEAVPTPMPTMVPTTVPLPTDAPPTVAATASPGPLAMESGDRPVITRQAPVEAEPVPERLSPVWGVWRDLRLLWIGLLGLLLVLFAALLWTSTKTRA